LDEKKGGPRIQSGMTKKAPRWTIAFLRALTRTGDVRAAAADAGIDYTTAYARRKAHAEFAGLWRGALAAHAQLVKRDEDEQVRALARGPPPSNLRWMVPLPQTSCGRIWSVPAGR
jgi:hypothetical protein